MIRSIIKPLFDAMPGSLQDEIHYQLNIFRNKKIVEEWNESGKPVPPPHAIKQRLINDYRLKTGYSVLIETGTLTGGMIDAQRKHFKKIYSIELSEELWSNAVIKFKRYKHIELIQGDSGKKMFELTDQLSESAIFWLDGHYSAGNTAMGDVLCPVNNELKAILRNNHLSHVVLIDDARNFNGSETYPSIEEIKSFVQSTGRKFSMLVDEDVIQIIVQKD